MGNTTESISDERAAKAAAVGRYFKVFELVEIAMILRDEFWTEDQKRLGVNVVADEISKKIVAVFENGETK